MLTQDDIFILELVIEGVKEAYDDPNSDITQWEKDFIADQAERYAQYGSNMRISDKQWAVINRVYDKVV